MLYNDATASALHIISNTMASINQRCQTNVYL